MKIVICDDEKIYVDKVYDMLKSIVKMMKLVVMKMLNNC